jgi:hypothetical protein
VQPSSFNLISKDVSVAPSMMSSIWANLVTPTVNHLQGINSSHIHVYLIIHRWAGGLAASARELFDTSYRGHAWSAQYNCQAFAKELIQRWSLEWKDEVVVVGEEIPVMMDIAILLSAASGDSSCILCRCTTLHLTT